MRHAHWWAILGVVGCAGGDPGPLVADSDDQGLFDDLVGDTSDTDPGDTDPPDDTDPPGPTGGDCYPDGIVEPMALGEVLAPYSWPLAIHRGTQERLDIDLAQVPCATDPDIDWSPHDVLVFVSIPAW
jgi:hypothetical protein